jgi:hypothetical protein
MRSDMYRHVLQHTQQDSSSGAGDGCADAAAAAAAGAAAAMILACVSHDHGFAATLRFAASRGCTVAAVTDPLKTRRRPAWAPPPDYSRYPLPAAARCCLVWDGGWLPAAEQAAAEAQLAAQWEREAGLARGPLPAPGGVAAAWRLGPPP